MRTLATYQKIRKLKNEDYNYRDRKENKNFNS